MRTNERVPVLAGTSMFLAVVLSAAVSMGQETRPAKPEEKKEAGMTTTLDNLVTAYNGESNAHARYVEFAKKADEDGYGQVASLFRAAARAEEIHAETHG